MMKLVSWNVNGLRACLTKGFQETFDALDADIFCLQETKMQEGQAEITAPGYHFYLNSAEKKRLFRNGCIFKERAAQRKLWH